MKRSALLAFLPLAMAAALAACGERDQTTLYRDGSYRGKPDSQPWSGAPPANADWQKGDRAGWQTEIRNRGATQNEYSRTGH